MAYEETEGPCINIENLQVGDYNTILHNSNSACLLHEDSCPTCVPLYLYQAVRRENRNNHSILIGILNRISSKVEELNRSQKVQRKQLNEVVWEQRRSKSNDKIKKKNKGGKLKNGFDRFRQYFKRKSKANTNNLEDAYIFEDDESYYDTISLSISYDLFEIQDQQPLNEEASQEQQSFRGESFGDQQSLNDEAIQDQQSLNEGAVQDQQSLSDEEIQDQQSLTEEGYSNLYLYSSSRNYRLYQRLNNHTNTDGNYKNVNEATVSASESTSYSVPTIASTVQNTNLPYKIYQSQFRADEWDVLY